MVNRRVLTMVMSLEVGEFLERVKVIDLSACIFTISQETTTFMFRESEKTISGFCIQFVVQFAPEPILIFVRIIRKKFNVMPATPPIIENKKKQVRTWLHNLHTNENNGDGRLCCPKKIQRRNQHCWL